MAAPELQAFVRFAQERIKATSRKLRLEDLLSEFRVVHASRPARRAQSKENRPAASEAQPKSRNSVPVITEPGLSPADQQWVAELLAWAESFPPRPCAVDDRRESQ